MKRASSRRARARAPVVFALAVASLQAAWLSAAGVDDAVSLARTGQYEGALELFSQAEGTSDALYRAWSRTLTEIGRYEEAEKLLRSQSRPALGNALAEVLYALGKVDEAEELFRGVVEGRGAEELEARFNLATLWYQRGELSNAEELFYSLIAAYNHRNDLTSRELVAVGRSCQALGRDNPQLFKDALKAFDQAIATDPSDPEPRVRVGLLFLDKYDSTEARSSIQDVLEVNPSHPDALLAMARIHHFDGSPMALELTEKSLESNPSSVTAWSFLGKLRLELEEFDAAEEATEKALAVNPRALEALSVLAAAHLLREDDEAYREVEQRALALNPRYADFYADLADSSVRTARYPRARQLAAKAVELDPKSWRGYGLLGLNELRLGSIEEGRKHLEVAFAGDPYNVWVKNTLDLLDTFDEYQTTRVGRFELFIHSKEDRTLAPYVEQVATEAFEALRKRYAFEPPTPIRIEVYPSHADFSVRTVGLAGLGALGVCFGPVVAIDSPSARDRGSHNWASTLWHELTHTFTLELTRFRVPRWLTEGLSVYEERRARPGWGDDVTPSFLGAYQAGELLGIAELNNGFVRPESPMQIGHSYYQASLIAEMIETQLGFDKILEILKAYREGADTEVVLASVLGLSSEEFDERFFAYLDSKFETPLAALADSEADEQPTASEEGQALIIVRAPDKKMLEKRAQERPRDFRAQLAWGASLFNDGKMDEAVPFLERSKRLFPQFASASSAHPMLAEIWRRQNKTERQAAELEEWIAIDESAYEAHVELAELELEKGERELATDLLERAFYIYPLEAAPHETLAALAEEEGNWEMAVRERDAIVGLRPADRVTALYQLARAEQRAGDAKAARRHVLLALELAPSYEPAQKLLLELVP